MSGLRFSFLLMMLLTILGIYIHMVGGSWKCTFLRFSVTSETVVLVVFGRLDARDLSGSLGMLFLWNCTRPTVLCIVGITWV